MKDKKKPAIDIILGMGGKDKGPPSDESDYDSDEDNDEPGDEGLDPAFETAYDDYKANPSAETFWSAVEACVSAKGSK